MQARAERTVDVHARSMPDQAQRRAGAGESRTSRGVLHRRARARRQVVSARPRLCEPRAPHRRTAWRWSRRGCEAAPVPASGPGVTRPVVAVPRACGSRHRVLPARSTPAARSSVARATMPSGAHAVGVARSGPNRCAWRSRRAGRDATADGAEAVAPWRSARTAAKAEARAKRPTRIAPPARTRVRPGAHAACHYPAGDGGADWRETGSDRRHKRPSGQWRQGSC